MANKVEKLSEQVEKLSDEQFKALMDSIQNEGNKREARKTLPNSEELKEYHDTLNSVVDKIGVDADEIRLVEMYTYIKDFPGFVIKVNNKLEEWKFEHATYRDPDNTDNFWYSPDGGGNPPKWIKDIASEKPKRGKKEKDEEFQKRFDKWLTKIEAYKVQQAEKKEAA